ncbi:hypothetical protein TcasGA2_TC002754 [Tribolium castaneum]|uniref:Uncharacterized protein n=1 Tax=Tribolium castaneum TaxID=7070 RepID=D6WDL1_TRICA|nr:hypothetical protein TcasGA2_TC002754 [Tribolium castaneum]
MPDRYFVYHNFRIYHTEAFIRTRCCDEKLIYFTSCMRYSKELGNFSGTGVCIFTHPFGKRVQGSGQVFEDGAFLQPVFSKPWTQTVAWFVRPTNAELFITELKVLR